jgi:hypothetical protein
VLSRRQWRIPPYLYSPEEVAALMRAAGGLAPAILAATWRTLIGLLAVTGMFSRGAKRTIVACSRFPQFSGWSISAIRATGVV